MIIEGTYTELDASKMVGISRQALARHRRAGNIRPRRVGRLYLYSAAILQSWLAQHGTEVLARQERAAGGRKLRLG